MLTVDFNKSAVSASFVDGQLLEERIGAGRLIVIRRGPRTAVVPIEHMRCMLDQERLRVKADAIKYANEFTTTFCLLY